MPRLIIEAPRIGEYIEGIDDVMVAAVEEVIFNVLAGMTWGEAIEVETAAHNFTADGKYSSVEDYVEESMADDLTTIADVIMEWEDTLSIDNVRDKFMLKYLVICEAPTISVSCIDNDTLAIDVSEYPLIDGDDDWIKY